MISRIIESKPKCHPWDVLVEDIQFFSPYTAESTKLLLVLMYTAILTRLERIIRPKRAFRVNSHHQVYQTIETSWKRLSRKIQESKTNLEWGYWGEVLLPSHILRETFSNCSLPVISFWPPFKKSTGNYNTRWRCLGNNTPILPSPVIFRFPACQNSDSDALLEYCKLKEAKWCEVSTLTTYPFRDPALYCSTYMGA